MTPPVTYMVPHEGTSPKFAKAFAAGCGGRISQRATLEPGSVALFGSPQRWQMFQQAIREGREWFYGDHGYFGRGTFYRITRNAYQHDGTGSASPDRFKSFRRTVQPWQAGGRHVLVCPNSATYFGLYGLDVHSWLREVMHTLRRFTDREIRVRWKRDTTPIAEDLRDAWAVVAFSSVSALDALIAGVPVFVLAPYAAALRMGSSDLSRIESPVRPDGRQPFLWNLAANQWTMAEIEAGHAWRALVPGDAHAAA